MGTKATHAALISLSNRNADDCISFQHFPADHHWLKELYVLGYEWGYSEFYHGKIAEYKIRNFVKISRLSLGDLLKFKGDIGELGIRVMTAGYNLGYSDKNSLGLKP